MSREHIDALRRSFDGWNRGDIDAWLHAAHPDAEWFSAIAGQVEGGETAWRGRAELRRFWDEWHSVWDAEIDVPEMRDFGDTILAIGQLRTRGKTSGIDLETPVAFVCDFEGAQIRRVRAYLDPGEALEAVKAREAR